MPHPVLPDAARNMSGTAQRNLLDNSDQTPIETFAILYYEDESGEVSGRFEEVNADTWTETIGGNVFTFQEISETPDRVILYDASRDRTVTIDWPTFDLTASEDGAVQEFSIIDQNFLLWARNPGV